MPFLNKGSMNENHTYVAEKKWRNSVFRGNSSGRFLHGPPLKWYIFTILQNILTFSRELLLNFIVIYILNSINYQYRFRLSQQIGCVVLLIISILISILLIIIFIIIIIIIMCCCCCCCCYIGKYFYHSWYIQYGRFIDIVLTSLLFS